MGDAVRGQVLEALENPAAALGELRFAPAAAVETGP